MNFVFIGVFLFFVMILLALDLGVVNRKAHEISTRAALGWCVLWVGLAAIFNVGIYFFWDRIAPGSGHTNSEAAMTFLAGYLLEESLSVDNVFVFALIFKYFRVPPRYQHRVLFWGVIGAIVMRGAIIAAGVVLVQRFEWILYIFGAILLVTGSRMAFGGESHHPERNPVVKLAGRVLPISPDYDGQHFFTRKWGRLMATPMLLVLLVVETSDLVFASDSLPAIFSLTQDATIIFTSNVFAILGLRSMYFVLAGMMGRFRFLNIGLAVVLVFIGLKILVHHWIPIPISLSLGFIALALCVSVCASVLIPGGKVEKRKE